MKSKPQWNAYVAAGTTKDERAARLLEVPEEWRRSVESHVKTVFAIKRFENRKRKERKNG